MTPPRGAPLLTALGVGLFWVGVPAAGALVQGYSHSDDWISSLAARGSPVAALGITALLGSALAHLAAARVAGSRWRSRLCAGLLVAAGTAVAVIAAFRQSCPAGPAGCGLTDDTPRDWAGTVHVAGVVGYELFAVAAMLTVALGATRRTSLWPVPLGAASLALAVVSLALVSRLGGDDTGLWQRLWVLTHHAWLLTVGLAAHGGPGRSRWA